MLRVLRIFIPAMIISYDDQCFVAFLYVDDLA